MAFFPNKNVLFRGFIDLLSHTFFFGFSIPASHICGQRPRNFFSFLTSRNNNPLLNTVLNNPLVPCYMYNELVNHVNMDVNSATQPDDMVIRDKSAFSGLFPISRQNSYTFSPETFSRQNSLQALQVPRQPSSDCYMYAFESKGAEQYVEGVETTFSGYFPISRQNSYTFPLIPARQNSLQVPPSPIKGTEQYAEGGETASSGLISLPRQNSLQVSPNNCYCGGDTCKQIYKRQSKYPRIIEPCSKLFKHGFDKKVQIRIPKELQTHIGYGSCKHCYKALVTLITYVQMQCGFQVRHDVIQTFLAPTEQDIAHARYVIEGFDLSVNFYVNTWAPFFQERFMVACGGKVHVQSAMQRFFGTGLESSDEPETDNTTSDTDDLLDAAIVMPPRNKPRHNTSYIERIEAILENESNTSSHKLALCNAVLYECLSKKDNVNALTI